jgi:hypothetical protein
LFLWRSPFVFVRFSILNKGSSKTPPKTKNPFGGSPCQKKLAEKVEKNKTFFLSSFPFPFDLFLSRFLAVVLKQKTPFHVRPSVVFLRCF